MKIIILSKSYHEFELPDNPSHEDIVKLSHKAFSYDLHTRSECSQITAYGGGKVRSMLFAEIDQVFADKIKKMAGFMDAKSYPTIEEISPDEIGAIGNIRFLLKRENERDFNRSLR